MNPRLLAALLLAAATAALFIWISSDPGEIPTTTDAAEGLPPEGDRELTLTDSTQCRECHPEVYDEWRESHHAFAWLNPEPRRPELSDNFRNKDCIPCHAPRPMFEVGFGQRALERETRREDGVNCFTCHKYRNVMLGANELTDAASGAPCNPTTWGQVSEMGLCAPCHDQHKVHQHWQETRFAVPGEDYQDCNDCHMPEVAGPGTVGGPRKTHRSHSFHGAHHPATLRTAATVRVKVFEDGASLADAPRAMGDRSFRIPEDDTKGRRLVIEVKNTGAGHNFPEDERHRAVDLTVRFHGEGREPGEEIRLTRFRNPYRHEFEILNPFKVAGEVVVEDRSWDDRPFTLGQVRIAPEHNPDRTVYYPESTQLRAGESRFLWLDLPFSGSGRIVVRLYYKLNPFMSEADAVLCFEETVEL